MPARKKPTPPRIVQRRIDKLIPYARNARTHSDDQIAAIAASIREFGFNVPILIDGKGGIIAGHGRVKAAKLLELIAVPTIRVDHLTKNQKRAFILADNKLTERGGWDNEILAKELADLKAIEFDFEATGFRDFEIEQIETEIANAVEPKEEAPIPEPPKKPKTKPGDLYLLGDHRLLCGDCTMEADVERVMNGKQVDQMITDPPYGVKYGKKNDYLNKWDEGNRIQEEIAGDDLTGEELQNLFRTFLALVPFAKSPCFISSSEVRLSDRCCWRWMSRPINSLRRWSGSRTTTF
jgi:hypothetical protein